MAHAGFFTFVRSFARLLSTTKKRRNNPMASIEEKITDVQIALDSMWDTVLEELKKIHDQLAEGDAESAQNSLEDLMEELEKANTD